jgi:hypothetical protein
MNFMKDEYGFWHQTDAKPFVYTEAYKQHQSTDVKMSFLRLGWLSSVLTVDEMRQMSIVDVGCGNGVFSRSAESMFKSVSKYDVVGESITAEKLYDTAWDIVVLSDVLEHFDNINDLFAIRWRYCFLSFPETPSVNDWHSLKTWRHFKPDEHLWCLNKSGVELWMMDNHCKVITSSNFEDLIRRRWDPLYPNITTMLIRRDI